MIKKSKFTLLVLAFITTGTLAQNKETPLTSVLSKYSAKWPKTVTFSQTTTIYGPNGERKQTWYEAGSFPDYFRIDFNREKGSSVLINKDKEYYFKEGKLVRTGPNTNPLILITNGMYFLPKDTVVKKLLNLGIDESKFHRYNWKGRKVIVVGTTTTDTTKAQLWFDEKELYLVRFIQPDGKDTMDVRFDFFIIYVIFKFSGCFSI